MDNNVYAAGSQIAEPVKNFLLVFQHALRENNMFQINNIYETGFDKLTEQHFKTRPWPSVEDVQDIVGNDQVVFKTTSFLLVGAFHANQGFQFDF